MTTTRRKFLAGTGIGLAGIAIGGAAGVGLSTSRNWRINSDIPRVLQVQTQDTLPAEADVVVIGAGVAGISTALFLNERGLKTVVLEKGIVAGEQSGRAFGWIYSNGWDLGKLELANRAKQIWNGFSSRFGEDIGFRQSGNYSLLDSDEAIEHSEEWLKSAREIQPQTDSRIVSGSELDKLIPGSSSRFKAALWQASDGTAEPTYSVPRIALGAMREGVTIVGHCAARTIEREGGKIAGVHTELGYIKARFVVVAGGAWSSLFARNAGFDFPQLSINSSMQRLSAVDGALPGAGYGPDFAWRMMANGETSVGVTGSTAPVTTDNFRYLPDFFKTLKYSGDLVKVRLSGDFFNSLRLASRWGAEEMTPFEQVRMLSATVDTDETDIALANLRRAWPAYGKAVVKERWAGMIDATPDSTPFVTEVPQVPGAFIITGFSGNGLTTGPAAGEMIAQMIAGEKTTCDPSIYRYDRFTDGSEFVFRH